MTILDWYLLGVLISIILTLIINKFIKSSELFKYIYDADEDENYLDEFDILLYSISSWLWAITLLAVLIFHPIIKFILKATK